MVEQGVLVDFGGGKKAMASSSTTSRTLPLQARPSDYHPYPPPMATYEEVVASPQLFWVTLEKLHAAMGTKFMIPTVAGRDLDLHRLFVEVTSRGGIAKILQERKWKDVIGVFSFPSSATNASFVLRKYYFSLLLHYEQIYFFKAEGWTSDASHSSSSPITPLPRELTKTTQSSLVNQAGMQQARVVESAKLLPEACPALSMGSEVHGVIDGKFESGYLITVKIGSEELKGVLYQAPFKSAHQKFQHQNTQQCQRASGSKTKSPSVALGIARRRRRKKSEIKKRDPAHPKPNRSGYNFFFAEQHARLKPLYPGKDREISKMIGDSWNKLNDSEKAVYQEKAVRDKERYRIEMEGYRERLRTGQTLGGATPNLQQSLDPHVSTALDVNQILQTNDACSPYLREKATISNSNGKNNLQLSKGQTITDAVVMQQQNLRPDLNLMDLDKNFQMEDAPYIPEKDVSSDSGKRNVEGHHQIMEKGAEMDVLCRAESAQRKASEEIMADEEGTKIQKRTDVDAEEHKLCSGDIAVEIDKAGLATSEEVPVSMQESMPAPDAGI
ncbi:high mobility group B protein 15-like [Coffea arabica]|uniref:High mobility group B protein 15-like n=1 Tax=Coffea arabica TaxID=13443 RepID=A0ABM4X9K6_COFAR